MVALLATVTGFANDSNSLTKESAKKTSLVLKNVKQGNILSIIDSNGIILYKEAIEINGEYKKGFDLSQLPDGGYVFELEKDLEIKTIPFTVKFNEVSFNSNDESTYFKPYLRQEGDLLYLSKLTPNSIATTIKVFTIHNGEMILSHSEKIENKQIIEKVFKLEKGKYKVTINSNNKEYTKFINN